MLSTQIKSEINNLWDKFWSGGIANPLTAIEQISYLLFMKRIDELDLKRKADAEFLGQKYTSIFDGVDESGEPNEHKRWSYFKQLEGGEMLKHVQEKVFPFIKNLKNGNQVFSEHMKDAVFIIPKASLLVEAVNIIDNIYSEIEREQREGQSFQDTQGDVYEYLLSEIASAGKNGQFRTPRHIIQMICSLVNPKLGEEICDPACGTGGFLLGAYQHILTQHTSEQYLDKDENGIVKGLLGDKLTDERQWQVLKEKMFYGYDFDTTMVRIGLMNLMLHGIDHPNIDYMDTLSKKYDQINQYDVVIANPPFTGSIDKGDINENLLLNTTKTELLFVNQIYNILRLGGRAGVVVPDGVLFGTTQAHIKLRRILIEQCELKAVISLPVGVFLPYADASTAVLIFVKGGTTENVWFYEVQNDGYTLDDKRSKIELSDIPDVINCWNDNLSGKGMFVSVKDIIENEYSLSVGSYKKLALDDMTDLPSGWNILPLSELIIEISEKAGKNNPAPVLSITKYEGFVESEKYFNKKVYSKDVSKYKVVKKNQFAYSPIHIDEGSVGFLYNFDVGLISPMYKVFELKKDLPIHVDPLYLFQLLKSNQYMQIYKNIGRGSVKRRKAISFDKFERIKILIPPQIIQDKIKNLTLGIDETQTKLKELKNSLSEELGKLML